MADTSYLFGGNTPSSVTGGITDTTSSLPAWLQEYTRALSGQATAVAGSPYQGYAAPNNAATYGEDTGRVAGANPMSTQAYQQIQANQGSYKPYTDYASQTLPQAIGSYMSPYTDSVVNRIAQLGQRNLSENLMPQVNSTFTGSGQFGSTRNADFMNNALRDANESIMGQQAQALESGYQNAATNALNDMSRYGALGQLQQQLGYQDSSMLDIAGQQQQAQQQKNMDLSYQDYNTQNDYQKNQLSFLSDIIRGMPVSQTGYTTQSTVSGNGVPLSPLAAAAAGFASAKGLANPTGYSTTGAK